MHAISVDMLFKEEVTNSYSKYDISSVPDSNDEVVLVLLMVFFGNGLEIVLGGLPRHYHLYFIYIFPLICQCTSKFEIKEILLYKIPTYPSPPLPR